MKQYLKYLITTLFISLILIASIVLGIIMFPRGVFHSSYQSVIVDKYRLLQNTNAPKIILISGSSGAFGLDQELLENKTGYKVVNLSLHAGFGPLFYTELSKENINPGDIVLLSYEYGWENDLNMLGQDLIMSGIDDNIDLYKHIPLSRLSDFIGYIFEYARKKYAYASYTSAHGVYSRESFDPATTQMIIERAYSMDYENNIDALGFVDLTDVTISEDTVEYLRNYKAYVEKKGATIYFTAPPLLENAIRNDYSEFDSLKKQEEELIGIPYISDPKEYIFPEELMSDTIYHCSSKGEKVRTELLIKDLKKVLSLPK